VSRRVSAAYAAHVDGGSGGGGGNEEEGGQHWIEMKMSCEG
jgi:hypothetical protein